VTGTTGDRGAGADARGADRAPVVVVGLGPVGATVALLVARAGVPVVAIERQREVYPHPRAVALDDDALRVLQRAGVRAGEGLDLLPGGTVRIRGRGGRPLVELGPPPTTTGHPGLAFFRQPQLERALRERLEAEPLIDLRLGTTVLRVTTPGGPGRDAVLRIATRTDGAADASGADDDTADGRATGTRAAEGDPTELRAAWVLACDGARSPIRTALGIRLRGTSSPSRWLVVDTDAPESVSAIATTAGARPRSAPQAETAPTMCDRPRPAPQGGTSPAAAPPIAGSTVPGPPFAPDDFEFVADPRGPWVHGPLPGGAHRWEFLLDDDAERGDLEDPAVARGLLAWRLPGAVPVVRRSAVYAFHARIAARWRVGRVLLLGDAAHLSPPFAGQGLCAGLRDAGDVAWKVAAAWDGSAHEDLLDTYAAERRPHALRTTALAVALGTVVELRRPRAAAVRDAVLARVAATRAVRAWIDRGGWRPPSTVRTGLVASDRRLRHRAGQALPQPLVPGAPPLPSQGVPPTAPAQQDPAPPQGPSPPSPASQTPSPPPPPPPADPPRAPSPAPADPVPLDDALPAGWILLGATDAGPTRSLPGVTGVPPATIDADGTIARFVAPRAVALVRPDRVVFGTAAHGDVPALLAAAGRTAAFRTGTGASMAAPAAPLADALGDESFVSLTTYRRSGEPVSTPVWVARDGTDLVVTTPRDSGKVKRLRHTARVQLRPCGRTGKVEDGAPTHDGHATLDDDPGSADRAGKALAAKYGWQYRLIGLVEPLLRRRRPDRVIVRITAPGS